MVPSDMGALGPECAAHTASSQADPLLMLLPGSFEPLVSVMATVSEGLVTEEVLNGL
jgi:hypothetical protein